MNKLLVSLFLVCFCSLSCSSQPAKENRTTGESLTEQDIRAAVCDIENKNYSNAQKMLEKVLKQEPQNIYAQRLLPGVLADQIKNDDTSPDNITKIKNSIEKYENFVKNSDVSAEDRLAINDFIISLIQMLPDSQKESELQKRAERADQTPQIRSRYFTALAAQSNGCANEITESVKKIVNSNGQELYVFDKPEKSEDFEKLKQCAAKGTQFIDKAIEFDSRNDIAWSYKGSLLIQKMRIAEMEGKTAEKDALNKELETVREKFLTLSDEKRKSYREKPFDTSEQKPEFKELEEEFTYYKFERPISELVKKLYIPFEKTIVSLIPFEESPDEAGSKPEKNKKNEKREWKVFSPENDEFTAELPDNVESSISSDNIVTYEASSENFDFMMLSQPKTEIQTSEIDDTVLNTFARTFVKTSGNLLMMDNSAGNFEAKLVRKENFSGFPARFYAYSVNSCSGKKEGIIIFMIGKSKNYSIWLNGVNEQDSQAQRFLKSWKIAGK